MVDRPAMRRRPVVLAGLRFTRMSEKVLGQMLLFKSWDQGHLSPVFFNATKINIIGFNFSLLLVCVFFSFTSIRYVIRDTLFWATFPSPNLNCQFLARPQTRGHFTWVTQTHTQARHTSKRKYSAAPLVKTHTQRRRHNKTHIREPPPLPRPSRLGCYPQCPAVALHLRVWSIAVVLQGRDDVLRWGATGIGYMLFFGDDLCKMSITHGITRDDDSKTPTQRCGICGLTSESSAHEIPNSPL